MSEQLFGEATVHLTPDLTGFVTELKKSVKAAVERVEGTPAAKVRIAPALTRDFVGQLRKQVNLAVAQAQKGIKPIQVRAILTDTSRAAIAREIRTGAQTVRATAPRASTAPQGAISEVTRRATTDALGLASATEVIAAAERKRIPLLGQLTAEQLAANKTTVDGARGHLASVGALDQAAAATHLLAQAERELALAQEFAVGSAGQARHLRAADEFAAAARVEAAAVKDIAGVRAAEVFRTQIRSVEGATAALDEHSRAARQAASNMSQLRRGVLSTALSFAGIRGATLAASARFLIGAAAIAVFAKAISSAAATAQQLNVFRATTQATSVEVERVSENARALGADLKLPGVTALDAAEAMTELAKAGLGVEDSIAGARGVLQLATAAAIDNAQAVELAANAINAFGLAGRDATHVADVFANAANAAQGSIVDIGIAFQQASAAGRQVGLSFEDTSEFLTILARNGLKGSDAGTSLRTALIRLIKPTKEAKEALAGLGVETRDAQGNLRPDVFIQLAEATRSLSPAARDAKIALIGGQDAFRAITILGRQSIDEFIRLRQELRQQGTAAELAEARMTGLRGAFEGLSNSLSSIGLRAGAALTPALQGIVEGLSGASVGLAESGSAASLFSSSVDALQVSLSALAGTLQVVGAVLLPVASAFASVTSAIGIPTILAAVAAYKLLPGVLLRAQLVTATLSSALITLKEVGFGLAARGAITGMASSLNLYVIAAAAVAAGLFFLITRETDAERATRKLKEATEGLTQANERLKTSAASRRDTALGVSGAQLGVLEAQTRVSQARTALTSSSAAKGTFERTKRELELKVALDNVKIAQNAVSDAVQRANDAHDEAAQASIAAETALRAEEAALLGVVDAAHQATAASRARAEDAGGRGGRGAQSSAAIEAREQENVIEVIRKRAAASREAGSAEDIATARRLELLTLVAESVNKIPTERQINIALETPNLKGTLDQLEFEFEATGAQIEDSLFKSLTKLGQSPEATAAIIDLADKLGITLVNEMQPEGRLGGAELIHGIVAGIDENAQQVVDAINRLIQRSKNLMGQFAGLGRQESLATIASGGATGGTLAVKKQQLENARQREANERALIAASLAAGGPGETPNIRKRLTDAINDQAALIVEINGINASLASDAKQAADDARTKQDEVFENILKAMGVRRDARQQAIEDAALTEGSGDDLAANRTLRRLVNVQIARIQERIKAARKQGKNVETLIAGLRVLEGIYRDLGRTVRDLQKTRQEEIQARIAESNSLDIEFAQTTGNKNAEIRARLKEIARLKRLQALAKNDILERKRLRNLIADQQKAIDDLRKQNDESNRALQELSFSFLTTQQGFAANLLGNLLPIGAIGGTVGANLAARGGGGGGASGSAGGGNFGQPGGPQPGGGVIGGFDPSLAGGRGTRGLNAGAVSAAAAATSAGAIAGPTRGQQSVELDLLRQILVAIRHLNEKTKHPENKAATRRSNAALETHH